MIPTTVVIDLRSPVPTAKQSRNGAKKGWNRFVARTDRGQKGAYMLVSDGEPFAPDGEQLRNVGEVFVTCDCDGDYLVAFVAHDGKQVTVRDMKGEVYFSSKKMISLCDRVDETLKMPYRERLVNRLASAEACLDNDPSQKEIIDRLHVLLAEVDANADVVSPREAAIAQIRAIAIEHGIDLSTL